MSNPREVFESALAAQRVADRVAAHVRVGVKLVKVADVHLDDKELIALGILTTLKPVARAKYLERHGIGYTAEDPTLASLIKKRLLKVQGKSLIPDQDKARDAMSKHERPADAHEWPASFSPRKTKKELLLDKMRYDQEAWNRSFGKL